MIKILISKARLTKGTPSLATLFTNSSSACIKSFSAMTTLDILVDGIDVMFWLPFDFKNMWILFTSSKPFIFLNRIISLMQSYSFYDAWNIKIWTESINSFIFIKHVCLELQSNSMFIIQDHRIQNIPVLKDDFIWSIT